MSVRHSLALVAVLLIPRPTLGGDRLLLAGGEAAEDSYYLYTGVVLPGPGRENGRGLLHRYWVDAFGYEYEGGPGTIQADAYGLEAALGYGTSFSSGWASAYVGLRYTNTDLAPDDPSAEARGSQTGLKVDVQGEREIAPNWRGNAIASWANQQHAYWTRGRLMRTLSPTNALGAEVVFGGNDESRQKSLGLVYTIRPAGERWSVGLKGGYRDEGSTDGAYAGVELGYGF
ncbi:MAG: cellulose biosynthesis protein BcsS [Gammaproteobacteria bacterium]